MNPEVSIDSNGHTEEIGCRGSWVDTATIYLCKVSVSSGLGVAWSLKSALRLGGAEDGAAERQPCEGAGGDCVGDRGSGADEDGFRGGGLTFARKGYTLRRFRQGVWAEGVNWTRGVLDARGKSVPTKKLSSAEPGWAHSHQWFVGLGVSTSVASAAEHKFLPFQSGVRARHGLSRKGKLLTLRTD